MKGRLNALFLGGFLVLSSFVTNPVMADESNKRTEFQFSAPLEIPGKVIMPGKYMFELADSNSDNNIVRVYSEDSNGNESLVATISAIPAYTLNTPDKPVIQLEERHAGAPEAIHSWFYPGDNTGWEFVYRNGQSQQTSAD
jgi:hypothetical protein